jgi:hypothetical protein
LLGCCVEQNKNVETNIIMVLGKSIMQERYKQKNCAPTSVGLAEKQKAG